MRRIRAVSHRILHMNASQMIFNLDLSLKLRNNFFYKKSFVLSIVKIEKFLFLSIIIIMY